MRRLFGCGTAIALIFCGSLVAGCTSTRQVASTHQAAKSLTPVETDLDGETDAASMAAEADGLDGTRLALLGPQTDPAAGPLEEAVATPVAPAGEPRTRLRRGSGSYKIGKPYKIRGELYVPKDEPGYSEVGRASWYGPGFNGRRTANGEVFDENKLTAAHTTLPLPSYARVTNLENGHSVVVRINDRGPYARDRLADLSKGAAVMLGFHQAGRADVKLEYLGRAPLQGGDREQLAASYSDDADNPAVLPGTQFAMMDQVRKGVETIGNGVSSLQKEAAKLLPVAQADAAEIAEDVPAPMARPDHARPIPIDRSRFDRRRAPMPLGYAATSAVQIRAFDLIIKDGTVGRR